MRQALAAGSDRSPSQSRPQPRAMRPYPVRPYPMRPLLHPAAIAGLLAPLALAGPALGQVSYYGSACTGASGAEPLLTIDGLPVATEELSLVVEAPGLTLGLMIGGDAKLFPGLALDDVGVPGCELLVNPLVFIPFTTDVDGHLAMPILTWTEGITLYVQAFLFDADAETIGSLTRAAEIQSLGAGGSVVVTEIMKDPDFVPDNVGEWVELLNRTESDIDIEGWTLRDDGTDLALLDAGGTGIVIPAGGRITVGNGSDPVQNGNIVHAAVVTGFVLENGADEVVLENGSGELVDRVAYDDSGDWPDEIGKTLALDAAFDHTYYSSLPEHWLAADCDLGGVPFNVDQGTPGGANDECNVTPPAPPSGELIFSEVMQNPKEVFDEVGEWFELHNTTAQAIDLDGWTLVVGGIEVLAGPIIVPAGGYALFARSGDPGENGGLPAPDALFGPGLFLGNGSEHLQLYNTSFGLVCELEYDNGGAFPDPVGRSMTLDPDLLDITSSLDGGNWCEATSVYGDGDRGTPGAPNDDCP